jgi:hypothetical protein
MWIYVVATRVKVSEWLGAFASLVVAVAILGSSLYLFIGVGFFSFINGVVFAFVVAIGLEVAYSKAPFTHQLGGILILVLGGFAGAWWGVTVLVVVLVVIVGTSPQLRMRWSGQSRSNRCFSLVSWLLALSTLLWTWTISMGRKIEVGHIGSTGTVPIVETMWFPAILGVVVALNARVADSRPDWRQRALHLTLALYVVLIWIVTMFEYTEPRYAAFKILVLLSLLTMVGLGVVLIERARSFGWPGVLVGLAMVVLWSSLVHESHNGVRGIGRNPSTTTVQSRILETLNQNVDADIVCLHQDPDLRIAAYLCSRLSASFSPGRSPALDNWTQALLNPDISPNGIEMPRESHIGSRVLSEIHRETLRTDLVVILIGGSNAEGIVKDLGPDFWWVNELKWSEISTVHL